MLWLDPETLASAKRGSLSRCLAHTHASQRVPTILEKGKSPPLSVPCKDGLQITSTREQRRDSGAALGKA